MEAHSATRPRPRLLLLSRLPQQLLSRATVTVQQPAGNGRQRTIRREPNPNPHHAATHSVKCYGCHRCSYRAELGTAMPTRFPNCVIRMKVNLRPTQTYPLSTVQYIVKLYTHGIHLFRYFFSEICTFQMLPNCIEPLTSSLTKY